MKKVLIIPARHLLIQMLAGGLFFYLSSFFLWAQVNGFQKTFHFAKYTYLFAHQENDGKYIFCGNISDTLDVDSFQVYLLKTDSAGNLLWKKRYKNTFINGLSDVIHTSDNGYIFPCVIDTGNPLDITTLQKTDSVGNILWRKYYYVNGSYPLFLHETKDKGIILSGGGWGIGAGLMDVFLLKTDSAGNLQWLKSYGGTKDESAIRVIETTDGGYAVISPTNSFGSGSGDVYLIKTDSGGNLQWSKTYGGTGDDAAFYINNALDGGYIMHGFTNSYGVGSWDLYLIKTDSNGNLMWSKTYGTSGIEYIKMSTDVFTIMKNKTYTLTGITQLGFGSSDILAINVDTLGNINWAKDYGSTGNEDDIMSVFATKDGGMAMSCTTTGFNAVGVDSYFIKTDSLGKSGCHEMDVTNSIIVMNVPTITTIPATQVDSGGTQATASITAITPSYTEQTICSCNLTASFTYTINNSELTCSNTSQNSTNWLWSFGDGNTLTQQNPVYTYSVNGSYKVCLTASDTGGCSDSICYTINITTGINEIEIGNISVNVYPNPATESFTIETEIKQAGDVTVTISNLLGETVQEIKEKAGTGKYKKTMRVEKIAKGVYFVRVKTSEGTGVRKIAVQ